MTPAAIDTALLILQNAVRHIRRTHMSKFFTLSAADEVAVALLEASAQRVLKGDTQ